MLRNTLQLRRFYDSQGYLARGHQHLPAADQRPAAQEALERHALSGYKNSDPKNLAPQTVTLFIKQGFPLASPLRGDARKRALHHARANHIAQELTRQWVTLTGELLLDECSAIVDAHSLLEGMREGGVLGAITRHIAPP